MVDSKNQNAKEDDFMIGANRYFALKEIFTRLPGFPIVYWLNKSEIRNFTINLDNVIDCKTGLICGNNNKYIRNWNEVNYNSINFDSLSLNDTKYDNKKYYPYNHGGDKTKWFGSHNEVVNLENNAFEMRSESNSMLRNSNFYFKRGITWNRVGSGVKFAARIALEGFVFDDVSPTGFSKEENISYILGYMNSKVFDRYIRLFSTGFKVEIGHIKKMPFIDNKDIKNKVSKLVEECIDISKLNWNSFEFSWDFKRHPLIKNTRKIETAFYDWRDLTENQFTKLKNNEEEINKIFIQIYDLNDEIIPSVDESDITIRKANLSRDIKSFISFFIGCIFGRYSLSSEGLVYAGGDWNDDSYKFFTPDVHNIIPITDEEYLSNDIVDRFTEFLEVVYGPETLEENLDFIVNALGNKGNTSREVIRDYFVKDFFKDHCKTYQKKPIYWLFDSGKQNGFKALVYMHRYNEDTIGNLRIDYLHKIQRIYENEIRSMQDVIDTSSNSREVSSATKRKDKLLKQLQETKDYDEKIAHLALARTSIDLDDGVKVNYEKVQTDRDGNKLEVLAKI